MRHLLLVFCFCACAHRDQPSATAIDRGVSTASWANATPPPRPRGQHVLAMLSDGSRHSGELVGATVESIVLGDAASEVDFTCYARSSIVTLLIVGKPVTFAYPLIGLAASGQTALALMPFISPATGGVPITDLDSLGGHARYGAGVPEWIRARCPR